jgi:hypothetical protein
MTLMGGFRAGGVVAATVETTVKTRSSKLLQKIRAHLHSALPTVRPSFSVIS